MGRGRQMDTIVAAATVVDIIVFVISTSHSGMFLPPAPTLQTIWMANS